MPILKEELDVLSKYGVLKTEMLEIITANLSPAPSLVPCTWLAALSSLRCSAWTSSFPPRAIRQRRWAWPDPWTHAR